MDAASSAYMPNASVFPLIEHNPLACFSRIHRILVGMDGLAHFHIDTRPWGNFVQFTQNEPTTVKVITITQGEGLSLQTHEHRNEFWHILSGTGTATVGKQTHEAKTGDSFFIPAHSEHRMEAGEGGVSFLEIAFGEFDENDIIRLEDRYGRQ